MKSQKTTVTFPANILKAMREYMTRENMGLHDQSKVVAEALKEYLTTRGVTINVDDSSVVEYEVDERN
jgi:hypothetical protein